MKTIRPVVEDDVVPQEQRGRRTRAVDPVSQIVGASVVVHDGTVDFGPGRLRRDENAGVRRVMDDQIDELRPRPVHVDAVEGLERLRGGLRDLESPKPRVRPRHEQRVRNGGMLARILAHHDRSIGRTCQRALEASRVCRVRIRSAAQPDRAARCDGGRAAEGRRQIPRIRERTVARRRAARRGVELRAGNEVGAQWGHACARLDDLVPRTGGQKQGKAERQGHPA